MRKKGCCQHSLLLSTYVQCCVFVRAILSLWWALSTWVADACLFGSMFSFRQGLWHLKQDTHTPILLLILNVASLFISNAWIGFHLPMPGKPHFWNKYLPSHLICRKNLKKKMTPNPCLNWIIFVVVVVTLTYEDFGTMSTRLETN